MASEVNGIKTSVTRNPQNAARFSISKRIDYRAAVKQKRKELSKSSDMPTSHGERLSYQNLYTGHLTLSSTAKKEFLNHANSIASLNAAKEVWNNPSSLTKVRVSPLGEGKDLSKASDKKNVEKKKKRKITNFNVYRANVNGRSWTVKTAQYKKGYETLYYISK